MANKDIQLYKAADKLVSSLQQKYKDWTGVSQFEGSVDRIYRLWEEFCWSPEMIENSLEKVFKTFEHSFEEMVVVGPISVTILCPHHMMPCSLKVITGYIPNGEGKVLGLSKFVRVARVMGKRPILQEQYCQELADIMQERLKPKGVAVYAVGVHGCMVFRGVEQEVQAITSVVKGDFKTEPETRNEFLTLAERMHVR